MAHYPNVDPNPNFPEMEKRVLEYWQREKIFEQSVEQRPATITNPPASGGGKGGAEQKADMPPLTSPPQAGGIKSSSTNNEFVFYDGPPFANGLPHYGHLLTGYVKDAIARYQTMKGKRVERIFGWDCHGLPAEMGSEKELGISGRAAITEFGIGKFNEHCRTSVMKYTNEWEAYVNRQARWVDFKNDYKTMDINFMESVLWAFKQLYDKGLVYEAYRVMPYSWAAETPLSNFETKLDNSYREREDKAITVAFELNSPPKGAPKADKYYVLAWTTTPWTLPSNLALAVGKSVEYRYQLEGGICYIHSAISVDKLLPQLGTKNDKGVATLRLGENIFEARFEDLLGLTYKPLFPYFKDHPNAFRILDGSSFVTDGDGTGIVHMAPGFGEDDQKVCEANGIELVVPVDGQGKFTDDIFDIPYPRHPRERGGLEHHGESPEIPAQGGDDVLRLKGLNVIADTRKEADEPYKEEQLKKFGLANLRIINYLKQTGQLIKQEDFKHNYPHCWRTDQPLIYRALPSWYVEVTKFRDRAVELNKQINWIPEHIRDGQMGHMLATAPDWSISRNRFWGTPIPVWRRQGSGIGDQASDIKVFGSIAEMEDFFDLVACGLKPEAKSQEPRITDLHRPFIDTLTIAKDGSKWQRVEDVFDCWFESGSMPFAQVHYPFENHESEPSAREAAPHGRAAGESGGKNKDWFESHFPADFITEYVGQTRGWFNTLIMLSTALFDKPPFKNCICHGVVLDSETGLKYSKRLKNYKDPMEVMDKFGADALRWLMLASPVMRGHDLSVDPEGKFIRDVVRLAIKPIWNAYNFFCLYANADDMSAKSEVLSAEHNNSAPSTQHSEHIMDRYILAKCNQAVGNIESSLDAYDTPGACDAVMQFFEVLNNWYIRRSKERFWSENVEADPSSPDGLRRTSKQAAYDTLYTVLVTMCRAAAPLLPLTLEEIYRGLTGEKSVHLTDFPSLRGADATKQSMDRHAPAGARDDEELIAQMDFVQAVCNAALSVRSKSNIRVRQPLKDLRIVSSRPIARDYYDIIKDEINVKNVKHDNHREDVATLKLSLNNPVLGKRLPEKMKQIIPASKKGEWEQLADGGIKIFGEKLLPEEYTLQLEPKPEYKDSAQALATNDALVILDTTITPELEAEGFARDLVRLIQEARKDAGLHVSDRIELAIAGDNTLINAASAHSSYITEQTLSNSIVNEIATSGWYKTDKSVDEMPVTIALRKAA